MAWIDVFSKARATLAAAWGVFWRRPASRAVVVVVSNDGFLLAGQAFASRSDLARALAKCKAEIVDLKPADPTVSYKQVEQAVLAIRDAKARVPLVGKMRTE